MNSRRNENLIIFAMTLVQPVLIVGSKLRFLGPPRVNFGSNLVKVAKNPQEARVWWKNMKGVILCGFWPCLTFSQPKVDQGHFGHFSWKRHFECSSIQMSYATSLYMFSWPHGENNIIGFFGVWHANWRQKKYGTNRIPSRTSIELILVSLEIFRCLVPKH